MNPCSRILLGFVVAPVVPAPVVPAHVATVIDNRCVICHSDPSPDFGRLDMSKWANTPDGSVAFVHQDAAGNQLDAKSSYSMILDVISTDDTNVQMPLGGKLATEDLEPFQAWLKERIDAVGKKPTP